MHSQHNGGGGFSQQHVWLPATCPPTINGIPSLNRISTLR
jgi:hypothetical protein